MGVDCVLLSEGKSRWGEELIDEVWEGGYVVEYFRYNDCEDGGEGEVLSPELINSRCIKEDSGEMSEVEAVSCV